MRKLTRKDAKQLAKNHAERMYTIIKEKQQRESEGRSKK